RNRITNTVNVVLKSIFSHSPHNLYTLDEALRKSYNVLDYAPNKRIGNGITDIANPFSKCSLDRSPHIRNVCLKVFNKINYGFNDSSNKRFFYSSVNASDRVFKCFFYPRPHIFYVTPESFS